MAIRVRGRGSRHMSLLDLYQHRHPPDSAPLPPLRRCRQGRPGPGAMCPFRPANARICLHPRTSGVT